MFRYFIWLAYDGSRYSGWQRQPNAQTVQETVEYCLSKLLHQDLEIVGCGRTDAGVHASSYAAHFDVANDLEGEGLVYKLNRFLPPDISVLKIVKVKDTAHARFDAIRRAYRYDIVTNKEVFSRDYVFEHPLHHRTVEEALELLNGLSSRIREYQEFFPFCKAHSGVNHYRCTIYNMKWTAPDPNRLQFDVEANRFLRGMIRLLVGAHLKVLAGQLQEEEVFKALDCQQSIQQAWSVPGRALFLTKVEYPEDIYLS